MNDVRTVWEKEELVRLISIRNGFEVPVGANIHCDDYVISLISRSLDVKVGDSNLDLPNSVFVCKRPMTSIRREPTNRFDALMCARLLGFYDASYP